MAPSALRDRMTRSYALTPAASSAFVDTITWVSRALAAVETPVSTCMKYMWPKTCCDEFGTMRATAPAFWLRSARPAELGT